MQPLSFLRRNPLLVFGAFIVAFAAWVLSDATTPRREPVLPSPENVPPHESVRLQRFLPTLVDEPAESTPQGTAQALPKLKPGMTRAEVEGLVGAPAAGNISPATIHDGRVTYHTQYEADLAPLSTVRPIERAKPAPPPRTGASRALVVLEFDATQPGHPLVGIHYPDPLF